MEDKLFLLGEMEIFGDIGEVRLVERRREERESTRLITQEQTFCF